jgi:hypothetical protein
MSGYPSPIYQSATIASGGTLAIESGATLDIMGGATVVGGTVQHARVTLTAAQILASFTTPITIVPAQGAGTIITLLQGIANLNFNSAAYVSANAPGLFLAGSISGTGVSLMSAAWLQSTSSQNTGLRGSSAGPSSLPAITNSPLVFATLTANPTAGNSTIDIDVWYTVSAT